MELVVQIIVLTHITPPRANNPPQEENKKRDQLALSVSLFSLHLRIPFEMAFEVGVSVSVCSSLIVSATIN